MCHHQLLWSGYLGTFIKERAHSPGAKPRERTGMRFYASPVGVIGIFFRRAFMFIQSQQHLNFASLGVLVVPHGANRYQQTAYLRGHEVINRLSLLIA